jgi:hypothetical protein
MHTWDVWLITRGMQHVPVAADMSDDTLGKACKVFQIVLYNYTIIIHTGIIIPAIIIILVKFCIAQLYESATFGRHYAGGGYTKRNVARCWTLETAALVGKDMDLDDELPPNPYREYYKQEDFKLRVKPHETGASHSNKNKKADIDRIKQFIFENLRHLSHAPGDSPSVCSERCCNPLLLTQARPE